LAPANATDAPERRLALNQFVGQSLMIPFAMIVDDKFRDGSSKMALAERDQPVETFSLIERMKRSACAFAFGARYGVG
jgi:hypothetical protein